MKQYQKILIGIIVVLVVAFYLKDDFIIQNEFGYLGMDKTGRQILIQSLDNSSSTDGTIKVDSEFYDTNFIQKIFFGEPMRTTLRFHINDAELAKNYNEETVKQVLDQPASVLLDMFKNGGVITLSDGDDVSGDILIKRAERYDIKTFEDLLVAFGFKKYEVYSQNKLIKFDLKNKGNTINKGGLLKATRIGYRPEKLKEDIEYADKYGELPKDYE